MVKSDISHAHLYLAILCALVTSMILYALLRLRRSRLEARERERLETLARQTLADAKAAAERASEAKSECRVKLKPSSRRTISSSRNSAELSLCLAP